MLATKFGDNLQIISQRVPNVIQGVLLSSSLGMTTWEAWNRDSETFVGRFQNYLVAHVEFLTVLFVGHRGICSGVTNIISRSAPFGAPGAVFQHDADLVESIANRVGRGEIFGGASIGTKLDQQRHDTIGR